MTEATETRSDRFTARITPTTRARMKDLACRWGGVRSLSDGELIEEAITRVWATEQSRAKEKR